MKTYTIAQIRIYLIRQHTIMEAFNNLDNIDDILNEYEAFYEEENKTDIPNENVFDDDGLYPLYDVTKHVPRQINSSSPKKMKKEKD